MLLHHIYYSIAQDSEDEEEPGPDLGPDSGMQGPNSGMQVEIPQGNNHSPTPSNRSNKYKNYEIGDNGNNGGNSNYSPKEKIVNNNTIYRRNSLESRDTREGDDEGEGYGEEGEEDGEGDDTYGEREREREGKGEGYDGIGGRNNGGEGRKNVVRRKSSTESRYRKESIQNNYDRDSQGYDDTHSSDDDRDDENINNNNNNNNNNKRKMKPPTLDKSDSGISNSTTMSFASRLGVGGKGGGGGAKGFSLFGGSASAPVVPMNKSI